MKRLSRFVKIAALGLAALFAQGCQAWNVGQAVAYHRLRPKLEWSHTAGDKHNADIVEVGAVEIVNGMQAEAVRGRAQGLEAGTWTPDSDLKWNKRYWLRVYTVTGDNRRVQRLIPVSIEFEIVKPRYPEANSTVMSLEPVFKWEPAQQPNAAYEFQVAKADDFATPLYEESSPFFLKHIFGPDLKPGTADDQKWIEHQPVKLVLDPNTAYYWRVRTIYYRGSSDRSGEIGRSNWTPTQTFSVARQPDMAGELVDTLSQVTSSTDDELYPAISVNYDIVCQKQKDGPGGQLISELVLVKARRDGDNLTYERGVQQVTNVVGITRDEAPAWDEKGEGIFFHSNRGRRWDIWYRNLGRRGLLQMTTNQYGAFWPRPSPDGSQVAYHAKDDQGVRSIWLMNRDGAGMTQVTLGQRPCWSPDGKRIAYTVLDAMTGNHHIWVMAVDGLERTQITAQGDNHSAAWSPDGKRLAYVSDRSGNQDIWILDVDAGSSELQVTNYLGTDSAPAWAPDGETLAFHSTRNTREYNVWFGKVKE